MNTTDKVQVGDSTTGTSTSTTASQWQTYDHSKAERGWECPRCGHINAPWVRQCDCSPSTYTWDKITVNPCDDWWKHQITCDDNMFRIHPESITYCDVAGDSNYKAGNAYVNIHETQSNKVDPNVTAWNSTNPDNCHTPHYTTETVVTDGIHNFYNLRTPKETK